MYCKLPVPLKCSSCVQLLHSYLPQRHNMPSQVAEVKHEWQMVMNTRGPMHSSVCHSTESMISVTQTNLGQTAHHPVLFPSHRSRHRECHGHFHIRGQKAAALQKTRSLRAAFTPLTYLRRVQMSLNVLNVHVHSTFSRGHLVPSM